MRVLVIEDYREVREAVVECLRENGYIIDATGTGSEGLWYAENHSYDVVLLDLMLPEIDGLEILRRLRVLGRDVPVIVMSAKDGVEDRVKGLDAGAHDYVVKPFSLRELLARVRAQTRNRYDQSRGELVLGALRADLSARRLWHGAREILLTAREYNLFEYLAYRQGQVVSRKEIWEHVYEDQEGGSSNVVDVYIGYLRKKLKAEGVDNLIKTRRGQGYVLEHQS